MKNPDDLNADQTGTLREIKRSGGALWRAYQLKESLRAALDRGLSNGRHEGLNNKVRLIIRRAYGFHSAEAALATVMLACGPLTLKLPYHTPTTHM